EEGRLAAKVPTKSLTEGPTLNRVAKKPAYLGKVKKFDFSNPEEPADFNEVFLRLLQSPNICSRRPIYEQYDHQVQTNTVILPGADAAVLRLKGKNAGLAVTTDGNGRYCYLDPFLGAQIAVAEAARNLVCVGAKPLGLTNCLNFGSPENPEVFWQFKEAVRGISEAARALETPVVSGNVSFYNEAGGKAIYPTPIIGMVGKLEELSLRLTPDFKEEGLIVLLGTTRPELGGSEYLRVVHNKVAGTPPLLDLGEEKRVQDVCLTGIEQRLLLSAHDLSEGGLAIALAECAILGDIGAQVDLPTTDYRLSTTDWLFSESQSRILVSLKKKNLARFEEIAREKKVNLTILGEVSGTKLVINDRINLSLLNLRGTWHRGLLAS
ncbi:MAG TPA: AIR synthase related protein, partial [Candidatus Subteraquimicrobiales bacterium]